MRQAGVHARLRVTNVAAVISIVASLTGWATEPPAQAIEGLGSAEFRRREIAQKELLEWGRKQPGQAMPELLLRSRSAADPEVRERCLSVLRSLVTDEYLKEGEGYIGIALALKDEIIELPGDPLPRHAIRVVEVREGTPGQRAGIQLNDLIVGLERETWQGVEASPLFREKIKTMKPNSNAELRILRNGDLMDLKVKLGRRPLMADMFFNGQNFDPEASERAAIETYFRRWLSQQKSEK
jgi:hypothetical protein